MKFCMRSATAHVRHYRTNGQKNSARNTSSKCHDHSIRVTLSWAPLYTCWWSLAKSAMPNVCSHRQRTPRCRSMEWWWMVTISTMNRTSVCNSFTGSKTRISLWMKWYLSQLSARVSHIGLQSISRNTIDHIPAESLQSRHLQNALIDMWVSRSHRKDWFDTSPVVLGQSQCHRWCDIYVSIRFSPWCVHI